MNWCTMLWFAPTVRAMGLSKSVPTPNTQDPLRVVTRLVVGAPDAAFPVPVAPIAPEPFVPDGSIPVKLITVIDAATLFERVAVIVTFVSAEEPNARQISAVPL